jgi:hypothetical protein
MKIFAAYILMLLPWVAFGQLFPKVPDFKGNIKKVIEKRYGKEVNSLKRDSGIFKPGTYSGWEYTYLFDENSKLVKRTNRFQEKVMAEYQYKRETIGNRTIEKEIIKDNIQRQEGDYIEYENFTDLKGRVEKVNFWSFNAQENSRKLFLVEKNAQYDNDRLIEFTRYYIEINGDTASGEKINLFYDPSDRLIRIERKDNELNLKTILYYEYNDRGDANHFSIDYLVGLRNYENNQKQDIYFKCDRNGNWVKRYWIANKKKRLEAKRKISYR